MKKRSLERKCHEFPNLIKLKLWYTYESTYKVREPYHKTAKNMKTTLKCKLVTNDQKEQIYCWIQTWQWKSITLFMDTSCFISRLNCSVRILQFAMTNANVKNHFIIPWWMFWHLTRTLLLLMMFTLVLLFLIWFQSWGVTIVSLPFQWRTLFNYAFTLTVDMIVLPLWEFFLISMKGTEIFTYM